MERDPLNIVIISSRLDVPGGTEKAIARLANLLTEKGYAITILVLEPSGPPFFHLHPSIQMQHHDLHFGITRTGNKINRKLLLLQHIRKLRKLIRQLHPAAVLSTEYHYAIAARIAFKGKVLSWEHHHFEELEKNRFWKFLLHRYYPRLDGVVCLNTDEAVLFHSIGAKTVVIPNFMEQQELDGPHQKQILTVARLSYVKGIDRLMVVAKELLYQYPGWTWLLIGEGDEESRLKQFIADNGLQNRLILQKPVGPDLASVYQEAGLYCMTSRNECFPMVLLEAMSFGVPCIAFDCETGPRHIIQNNENGFLVAEGDIHSMVEKLGYLMDQEDERVRMGNNAYHHVEQFSPARIYQLWERLLKG